MADPKLTTLVYFVVDFDSQKDAVRYFFQCAHAVDTNRVQGRDRKRPFGRRYGAIDVLVMTGLDKRFEAFLVDQSPQWLTDLTTRF
jgi:hypothetical protein